MHTLPTQLTQFVGRVEEITELQNLLANPDCRLLTLIGVGGIGKTRLALQTASQMADDFADGVYFVPLQPINSIPFFFSTIADAIGFTAAGTEETRTQLLNHISRREMLLIIDNFEHLLADAAVLSEILEAAPHIKLLVTSRESLRLMEEWLYPIQGLAYPKVTPESQMGETELTSYSAVQLFIERARRVRRGFAMETEAQGVVEICQLVEGMPLALELAATWTQSLTCAAIAKEIRNSLDFLATDWRNVPDRQRSMRAVFDHAYELLTPNEQEVFKRMSVFRGGFHRKAAAYITGASLSTLGSLVSHSLLRWETVGRYQIHELLRQYADELLRESPEEKVETDERHCTYYTDFLYSHLSNFAGSGQLGAVHEIDDELENILAAWQYAVDTRNLRAVGNAIQAFALYYEFRSRHLEGIQTFEAAMEKLELYTSDDPETMLVAIRFIEIAWFYVRLGRFDDAEAYQKRVQECYDRLGIPPIEGSATDPLLIASILANIRGEYDDAIRLGEQALKTIERHPHPANLQYTQYVLAGAHLAQGNFQEALRYAQAAYANTQETQDRWFMAYCLIEMGNVASAMRDYGAARRHLEASYAIRKEFNDPEGMAVALAHLGEIALHQAQYQEAREKFEQSVALYRDINDRGGLARALEGLGNAHCALEDYATARNHLARALEIAGEIQFVTLMCTIITSIANLLLCNGSAASGLALLAQIVRHPSSTTTCKARRAQLIMQFRATVDPEYVEIATAQTHTETINALAEMAQIELAHLDLSHLELSHLELSHLETSPIEVTSPTEHNSAPAEPAPPQSAQKTTSQPLIDPLTARELEVLNLIVEGLSNQQIASTLYITRGTVKWYTSQIYSKLGIDSRTKAIGRARELSLTS